jgi:glyoxylase I family protein
VAVLSVHHVSLVVKNTAQALQFYQGILGLALVPERPALGFPGAWLSIGEQQIHLLEVANPDPVNGRPEHGGRDRHLAVLVDDLQIIEDRLQQHQLPFTRSRSGRAAIFCRDYDGNGVELILKSNG